MTNPTSLSNCINWLLGGTGIVDALGNIVENGKPFAKWQDQSGNGTDATAITGTNLNQPIRSDPTTAIEYCYMEPLQLGFNLSSQSMSLFMIIEGLNLRGPSLLATGSATSIATYLNNANFNMISNVGGSGDGSGQLLPVTASTSSGVVPPSSRTMIGFSSNASGFTFVFPDSTVPVAATPSVAINSPVIGAFNNSGTWIYPGQFRLVEFFAYTRSITASEIAQVQAYSITRGCVARSTATRVFFTDGDSIAAGSRNSAGLNFSQQLALSSFGPNDLWYNFAIPGVTLNSLNANFNSVVAPLIKPGVPNILIAEGGFNDLGGSNGASGVYTTIQAYGAQAKTAGMTKVLVTTLTPSTAHTGSLETARQTYNTDITGNFNAAGGKPTWADGFMNWGNDAVMGTVAAGADPTQYPDGTHPSNATSAIMANYIKPFVAATGYTMTAGAQGLAVTVNLLIAVGATWTGNQTVQIAWGDGQTTTVTPTNGTTLGTATHTYASAGNHTITPTNGQGWTDPAAITIGASAASTSVSTSTGVALTKGTSVATSLSKIAQDGNSVSGSLSTSLQ